MKIAFFSTKSYDREYFNGSNSGTNQTIVYFEESLNTNTVELTKGYLVVCAFVNDKLDKPIIVTLAKNGVKLIALRSAGFNNVDLEAAFENNIKVVRVPAYSPQAVAEHTVALILTLNRKTHKAYNRIREGNFSVEKLVGFNLFNKTIGVIGTGKIGAAFCEIMLGFGCHILACDMNESDSLKAKGVLYKTLDEILQNADIISLHCPLTPQTNHLIDKQAFSKMKDGVMLINTGRGALIDSKDAIEALKSKKLGYLGIDVYEQEEKLFFRDLSENIIHDEVLLQLIGFPNVLITSHQGFLTKEALEQIAVITLRNIANFEHGVLLENEVISESAKNKGSENS